jgi:transcription elongation factor GreA
MSPDTVTTDLPVVLTPAGRAWLEDRLARATARLERLDADLSVERTDQLIAEQQQLHEQIDELRVILRDAVAPGQISDDPDIVEIGDEVEVAFPDGTTERFQIVHPVEVGLDDRRVSAHSPLASAVLGHRPGDRVTVAAPSGVYGCTVVRRERIT